MVVLVSLKDRRAGLFVFLSGYSVNTSDVVTQGCAATVTASEHAGTEGDANAVDDLTRPARASLSLGLLESSDDLRLDQGDRGQEVRMGQWQ